MVHKEDEILKEHKSESLTLHRTPNQKHNEQSEVVYMPAYVTFLKCQSLERRATLYYVHSVTPVTLRNYKPTHTDALNLDNMMTT